MSFLFPAILTIGLPLIAVPIAIHLINLRRQQRIRWAAMQFLLESQRRNRRWILLKQLLLLFTRMAVVGLLVLMLAHLVLENQWLRILGQGTTHHLVLLDDSYSMSDRWEQSTAFDEGKRAIQAIVDQASSQSDRQLITMLRFSEAAKLSAGALPEVFSEPINDTFRNRLEALLNSWDVSQTDEAPTDALKAVRRLPLERSDHTLVLYLVSDFRARQFASSEEMSELLADLSEEEKVAQTHLVRCANEARPNLAITSLMPESGVRAAGVEMWMSVTVANYGDAPARGVTVQLEQDGDALPSIALDDIPPRDELKHKFRVQFAGVGAHSLTASLGPDSVDVDNRRYFACDLPAARPVLIVDGSPDGRDGRQLSLALSPGGNTRTGWQPHVEPASFLTDREQLSQQAAVFLLDVPRLADDELAALEDYVRAGGGVALFIGPNTDRSFYNDRFYRDGTGPFPVALRLPKQLLDQEADATPDLEVTQHPLFQVLSGRRNGFLPLVMVDYYYALADDWALPDDGSVSVLAKLRDGAPLVVEKEFGEGRVVAQLTKLSSADTPLGKWSNWSLNPAFPVLANELAGYLATTQDIDPLVRVGDDLMVNVDEGAFEPTIRFLLPLEKGSGPEGARAAVPVDATPKDGRLTAKLDDVAMSGVYRVELQPIEGEPAHREYAVNVSPGEGDLAIEPREGLTRQLAGVNFELHDAADMALNTHQLAGFRMTDALLAILVVALVAEQLFAYMASYHVAPLRGATR